MPTPLAAVSASRKIARSAKPVLQAHRTAAAADVGVGVLRFIALIEEAAVINRILRHLGLPPAIPAPRPARAPPIRAGVPDAAAWDDQTSVFDSCS